MAEFKRMTVQALRDLARKAIGRGHSKLKTKAALIDALRAAEKKVATAAAKAAEKMKGAAGLRARKTGKAAEASRGERREGAAGKKGTEAAEAGRGQPAEKGKQRRAGAARSGTVKSARAAREAASAAKPSARPARATARGEPEPDPEGYMVARVAGEEAVRDAPHPMTESAMEAVRGPPAARDMPREPPSAPGGRGEQLGELPWSYGDDVLAALPRDPRTLFLYWDHAKETLRQAFQDLDGGRPQLWIFALGSDGAWRRVRAIDFALESRSYYVHDLEPNDVYRAEIHVVDRHGADRLVARPSNEMMLPPSGPSPIVEDRILRILWGEPLQRLLRDPHPGAPFPEDVRSQLARLSDWSRFVGRPAGASAGGMGGRPSSPGSPPFSPSPSPSGSHADGEGR